MRSLILFLLMLSLSFTTDSASAATVQYSGTLYSKSGSPINGGYVVAGTFAPGVNYQEKYRDGAGDQLSNAYNMGVAAGYFIPIGEGILTNANGTFMGDGMTSAAAGTPIWLYAFEDASRDSVFQAVATSTASAWQVPVQPSGSTAIVAADANLFIMGSSYQQGIQLVLVPVPEPTSLALMLVGGMAVVGSRFRRR